MKAMRTRCLDVRLSSNRAGLARWTQGWVAILAVACSSSRPLPETDSGVDDSSDVGADDPTGAMGTGTTGQPADEPAGPDASADAAPNHDASIETPSVDGGLGDSSIAPGHESGAHTTEQPEAGDPNEAGASRPSLLDDPLGPFPERFSDVGLYEERGKFERTHARALSYEPRYPLWSNGGDKQRYLVLPSDSQVDISDRQRWQFPVGTLLFKTFFFRTEVGGSPRAIETRVLRHGSEGWDYVVYVWDEAQEEALLSDMSLPIAAQVLGPEGEAFEHLVPSGRQCSRCHDAGLSNVLGFSELQLNDWDVASETQLHALSEASLFEQPLEQPALRVEFEDPLTQEVIGYMQGNCVHCHNGQDSELNAFDMRPDVALANLIDQPTQSNASASGIRVTPGDPEQSVAFLALSGETDNPEVQQMPNVGVQLRDAETIELFRSWILSLE